MHANVANSPMCLATLIVATHGVLIVAQHQAIKGRRDKILISTKTSLPMGEGPNEAGSSRSYLIRACEAALRRLGTDYIDLLQLHAFDAGTPVEEVLATLDGLIRAGKVRYVGVSNFSGWQVMKSLAAADRHGWSRYVAHQVYYSLVGRDYVITHAPF